MEAGVGLEIATLRTAEEVSVTRITLVEAMVEGSEASEASEGSEVFKGLEIPTLRTV